jgi:Predicted phosphoesterase
MRALAIYNTRGMVAPLEMLRKRHLEHCDLFIHCGNSMVDYQNEFIEGYVVIKGSDDFDQHFLRDYMIETYDQRILIVNNIDYRAQDGFERLTEFVKSLYDRITIVICAAKEHGYSSMVDDIIYVCPGDANLKNENSYVIIETDEEGTQVNIFDIDTSELKNSNYFPLPKKIPESVENS